MVKDREDSLLGVKRAQKGEAKKGELLEVEL
jgi:hypothetical protein